jgi:hypothetical protein
MSLAFPRAVLLLRRSGRARRRAEAAEARDHDGVAGPKLRFGVRAVAKRLPPRGAAIFAVVANAQALTVIVYGIATAPVP